MHPVTLAIPLSLFAIWFLDTKRLVPFAICAVLIAATGELMGLPIACLGLWYWLKHRERRTGLAIAVAGFSWTLVSVEMLVPAFSGSESNFYSYYASIGGSPEGVVRTALTNPGTIIEVLFTRSDLFYWFALAVPLAGVFLLAPALAAAAIPQLAANGLASLDGLTDPRGHHVAAVIPFLVAATVFGLARFARNKRELGAFAVVTVSALASLVIGPWPGVPGAQLPWLYWWSDGNTPGHIDALRDAVALVPGNAPVSATTKAGSYLSARRYFYSVPVLGNAEWIVIDAKDSWVPLPPRGPVRSTWGRLDPALLASFTARIEQSPSWDVVFERSGVFVFRKVRL